MRKRIYISADYDQNNGDRDVVDELNKWGSDDLHKIDFVNMASVVSGSVSDEPDCRICELKNEFNKQINASSIVIFIVGDKTKTRKAGEGCERCYKPQSECQCTPYKQNTNGVKACKVHTTYPAEDDIGPINDFSYLRHEFEQAKRKCKEIIILYNSTRCEEQWLPFYMKGYKDYAMPFWVDKKCGVGNYYFLKEFLL